MDIKKIQFLNEIKDAFGTVVSRKDILPLAAKYGFESNLVWLTKHKVGWGQYDIAPILAEVEGLMTAPKVACAAAAATVPAAPVAISIVPSDSRTDEEIINEQNDRFHTLERLVDGIIEGHIRAVIVSGPAGIGKTYTIERELERAADHEKIVFQKVNGFVRPTGLYKLLWENRHKNSVLLLDDSDSAFQDEVALNILKAALDTNSRREISWKSEKIFTDEFGEEIPSSFVYEGSIIFITNLDFERLVASGNKLAPHFAAFMSRCFYLNLQMNSTREKVLRISHVLYHSGMADSLALTEEQVKVLDAFIKQNAEQVRELSLRTVVKLAKLIHFAKSPAEFIKLATSTCLKS
jgi:hypothetical protein